MFFTYVTTYRSKYDTGVKPEPQTDTFPIEFMSFAALFLSTTVNHSAVRGGRISALDSFLEQVLPNPMSHLVLTSREFCFYCHIRGGFLVQCNSTSCNYSFHPGCFRKVLSAVPIAS